jgi:hypothetical protein
MPTGRVRIEIYNAGSVAVFIRKGTDATVTALLRVVRDIGDRAPVWQTASIALSAMEPTGLR